MGMTRIVVEGKVWWGRPRMRCRHKAHLGRASTLFECFAEVRRLFYVNLVVCVSLDGWADNGERGEMIRRGQTCWALGRFSRLVTIAIWRRATLSASLCLARRA